MSTTNYSLHQALRIQELNFFPNTSCSYRTGANLEADFISQDVRNSGFLLISQSEFHIQYCYHLAFVAKPIRISIPLRAYSHIRGHILRHISSQSFGC